MSKQRGVLLSAALAAAPFFQEQADGRALLRVGGKRSSGRLLRSSGRRVQSPGVCYVGEQAAFSKQITLASAGAKQKASDKSSASSSSSTSPAGQVPAVTGAQLQTLVDDQIPVVAVFFASWCPHCQVVVEHNETSDDIASAPYEIFYSEMQGSSSSQQLKVVKFDGSDPAALGDVPPVFGQIQAFPTVRGLAADGGLLEFDADPRVVENLVAFGTEVLNHV